MSQQQLEQEIAKATGESLAEIRRLGFSQPCSLVDADDLDYGDLGPNTVDWDELDAVRHVPLVLQASRLGLVA